ncbi:MAG: ribonuclease HI family protein [Dehalococcoidia bacterium]
MSRQGCWTAYADGAARGNPGPSAIGAVILNDEKAPVHRISRRIGHGTNNEAEYRAAIAALEAALALGATCVILCLDSELVVRQLQGRYRVRNPRLRPLLGRLEELRRRFLCLRVEAVPRAENQLADALANRALDGPAVDTP